MLTPLEFKFISTHGHCSHQIFYVLSKTFKTTGATFADPVELETNALLSLMASMGDVPYLTRYVVPPCARHDDEVNYGRLF